MSFTSFRRRCVDLQGIDVVIDPAMPPDTVDPPGDPAHVCLGGLPVVADSAMPPDTIALVDTAALQARVAAFTMDAFKAAGAEEVTWAPHPTEPDAIVVTLRLAVPPAFFEMSPTLAATLAAMDAPPKEEP